MNKALKQEGQTSAVSDNGKKVKFFLNTSTFGNRP